jgi:hypothetical protein
MTASRFLAINYLLGIGDPITYLAAQFWRLARRIGRRRPPSPSATRSW